MIDPENITLLAYFKKLSDKQIQSITLLKNCFQIHFVDGLINCISETFISTQNGNFQIPSKEGTWELYDLIGKEIISVEEQETEIVLKADNGSTITVNTRLGSAGDTFHITVEGLPTLHF